MPATHCRPSGMTFDLLFAMAKDLHEAKVLMLLGAGRAIQNRRHGCRPLPRDLNVW